MIDTATAWPWLAFAAFGLFHGLNPAMGWLFAVALGLYRKSQKVVLLSLVPIAFGHALSIALALALFLAFGLVIDRMLLMRLAAIALIGFALFHVVYGHRQRPVVGMQTGLLGLFVWSFLMASAHGAGLMLIPALLPLCGTAQLATGGAVPVAIAALALHSVVMLTTIGLVAIVVYNWIDIGFLRRGWINLDRIWVGALFACGIVLLVL